MAQLHGGTVTFLFTDIEGSTRLLQQLRGGWADVLATHHRLLRDAFTEAGGEELGTEGDAFFVVFRRARDAVAGAVGAQRALAAHEWPEGAEVRVRMGIHTGEPEMGDEGYHGMALHRSARICSAGHGGQILLSNATRELVEDDLPPGVALRDLREHRLKDLARPERIFQLVVDGLRTEFPPLKTLDTARRRPLWRRRGVLVALLAGAVAAIAVPLLALGGGGSGVAVAPNSVAVIDPSSNRVVDAVPVGARPGAITFGSKALWVVNAGDRSVSKIDVATARAEKAVSTGEPIGGLAAGAGAVWGVSGSATASFATVRRIDPAFDTVSDAVRVPSSETGGQTSGAVAVADGTLWVVTGALGQLARVDAATGDVVATIEAGVLPFGVAVGGGAVWVTDFYENAVTRVDPETNLVVKSIQVGLGPTAIAYGAGGVWVVNSTANTVVRVDPRTDSPTATIRVGSLPAGIGVGDGAVWVANSGDGTVSRIDPRRNEVVATLETGGAPTGVAVADGRVWVTVEAREAGTVAARGTARLEMLSDPGPLDPAVVGSPAAVQLARATCAKLVDYADASPVKLEPDAAASLPSVSADGRTYTFTIRRGFRFSPPSGEAVTAATFKHSIERSLSPAIRGPAFGRLATLVGVEAYQAGTAAHVAGLEARGDTLTIRVTEPAPTLLQHLALPYFCAVPTNTPIDARGVPRIPSAGPFFVASYTPAQAVVLERNPNYGGRRRPTLERIRVRLSVAPVQSVANIEAGRADYALEGVPREAHRRLSGRYGPASRAAKAGHRQYFASPELQVDFLVLNARRRLFASARLRRAVSYAVDRRALAPYDVFALGLPADRYLPPAMPGVRGGRLYPLAPDVRRARSLAGAQGATAVLATCNLLSCRQLGQRVKDDLARIGIEVDVEELSVPGLLRRLQQPGAPFDLAVFGFRGDVADPGAFLAEMLAIPVLDLRGFEERFAAVSLVPGPARARAFARLADELARDASPVVAFANPVRQDFFSRRIGCQAYNPLYGMDLAALCVRRAGPP